MMTEAPTYYREPTMGVGHHPPKRYVQSGLVSTSDPLYCLCSEWRGQL